jgi:hypothetical protein
MYDNFNRLNTSPQRRFQFPHDRRVWGLQKWSGQGLETDWVRSRYGLDKGCEVWRAVEMVWTFDKRLGALWKWSGCSIRGWVGCGNGLDVR